MKEGITLGSSWFRWENPWENPRKMEVFMGT
jgi:hypothetical protein